MIVEGLRAVESTSCKLSAAFLSSPAGVGMSEKSGAGTPRSAGPIGLEPLVVGV